MLLLDEPTNNLDPASREEVLGALRGYRGAIVLVTHDEGAVEALSPERCSCCPTASRTSGATNWPIWSRSPERVTTRFHSSLGWPMTRTWVIMAGEDSHAHNPIERGRNRGHADTLKKGSRVTGGERDRLAADLRRKYDAGASIRALADATGRSYGFIHRMLSESGATLRGRGGATRGKARAR